MKSLIAALIVSVISLTACAAPRMIQSIKVCAGGDCIEEKVGYIEGVLITTWRPVPEVSKKGDRLIGYKIYHDDKLLTALPIDWKAQDRSFIENPIYCWALKKKQFKIGDNTCVQLTAYDDNGESPKSEKVCINLNKMNKGDLSKCPSIK